MYKRFFSLFLLLANGLVMGQNPLQSIQDTMQISIVPSNPDPLGRVNPKGTVTGFFNALAMEDYLKASRYTDLADIMEESSDSSALQFVKRFESLLNRYGKMTPINLISDQGIGNVNDGLDAGMEMVGSITYQGNTTPLLLTRSNIEEGTEIWLFTTGSISPLIEEVQASADPVVEHTDSGGLFSTRWRGASIKDWTAALFLALVSFVIAWLLTLILSRMVRSLWKNYEKSKYRKILQTLLLPLRLVLVVYILLNILRALGISIVVRQAFGVFNLILMWTALFIFIWLLIDALTMAGEEKLRERKSFGGLSAISFFRNTAKFVLIVTALLIVFSTVGVNVTAGLAALGVGGIALALGAQKTIENVIGGLSVVFDQPVSVGDFCKFGDTLGTVEKIGMRSTRIRTNQRTVVTIPNSDFSSRLIENYSKRDLFLYHKNIGLRYETSSHQLRYVLVELRKILYAHPLVDPNPARVRFLGYRTDSLHIEIYAYTYAKDWNDYLGIQEDLNLRLAEVIEDSGSGFAFPTQRLYIARDNEISETKREEIERKVNEWIEKGKLQLPEFDEETINRLRRSIPYPPGKKEEN